jgi:hypothetical protein
VADGAAVKSPKAAVAPKPAAILVNVRRFINLIPIPSVPLIGPVPSACQSISQEREAFTKARHLIDHAAFE